MGSGDASFSCLSTFIPLGAEKLAMFWSWLSDAIVDFCGNADPVLPKETLYLLIQALCQLAKNPTVNRKTKLKVYACDHTTGTLKECLSYHARHHHHKIESDNLYSSTESSLKRPWARSLSYGIVTRLNDRHKVCIRRAVCPTE